MEGKSEESARVCSGETNPEAHARFFQMTPRAKKQTNVGNLSVCVTEEKRHYGLETTVLEWNVTFFLSVFVWGLLWLKRWSVVKKNIQTMKPFI